MKLAITALIMSLQEDMENTIESLHTADTLAKVKSRLNWFLGKLSAIDNLVNVAFDLSEREEDELEYAKYKMLRKVYEQARHGFARHADEMTAEENAEIMQKINDCVREINSELKDIESRL